MMNKFVKIAQKTLIGNRKRDTLYQQIINYILHNGTGTQHSLHWDTLTLILILH